MYKCCLKYTQYEPYITKKNLFAFALPACFGFWINVELPLVQYEFSSCVYLNAAQRDM